ncbi:glutaredoxin 3 [Brevundimonas sp.]|uniref:glutaredoxin 3 n=1 Tax=Brevundimonas sp. TaxID=1871086 RepID=UPI00391D5C11
MAKVVIYTKPYCPYCVRALALLERKGADFEEIEAAFDAEKKAEMIQRSNGRRTFPQVFIGETHVGGSDELHALDARGGLDELLAA